MLTLINTNRMRPPIAPIGLDYVAGALEEAGIEVRVLDLCLEDDPKVAIRAHFAAGEQRLVALSYRNTDDCFFSSGRSFVRDLIELIEEIRRQTDAPIVLGGVGYSIFAERLLEETGAEFGVRGDGEPALPRLWAELTGDGCFEEVPGLIWRSAGVIRANPPAWPEALEIPTSRRWVDNVTYFELGGQGSVETKRGCPRGCLYCADPAAKGPMARLRPPRQVAEEVESLLSVGVDVLHLCDGEFNIPLHQGVPRNTFPHLAGLSPSALRR